MRSIRLSRIVFLSDIKNSAITSQDYEFASWIRDIQKEVMESQKESERLCNYNDSDPLDLPHKLFEKYFSKLNKSGYKIILPYIREYKLNKIIS